MTGALVGMTWPMISAKRRREKGILPSKEPPHTGHVCQRSRAPYTHHAVLFMVIAQHWEASPMSKGCHLPKSFIIDGLGHNDNWRVRRADSKFLVDITQSPFTGLENTQHFKAKQAAQCHKVLKALEIISREAIQQEILTST